MRFKAKYLALGDSYTIGESVPEAERFPAQAVKLLNAQNVDVTTLKYIAATGWTTLDLAYAINEQNPAHDFDIVTLLIGVNDQYQQFGAVHYHVQFAALLNKAVALAGNQKRHVFVLSIPDYSVTPFVNIENKARVSTEIDEYNAINKEITLQNSIAYIDLTPSTRQAANNTSLVAHDGLHPSAKEYAIWANMLVPLIKKAFIIE